MTKARLFIRGADGWQDMGEASLVIVEMQPGELDKAVAALRPLQFEIEYTLTWASRWLFALPPLGSVPMYN